MEFLILNVEGHSNSYVSHTGLQDYDQVMNTDIQITMTCTVQYNVTAPLWIILNRYSFHQIRPFRGLFMQIVILFYSM